MQQVKYPTKRRSKEHYIRLVTERTEKLKTTFYKRFFSHINRGGINECWNWTGPTLKGYGVFGTRCAPDEVKALFPYRANCHRLAWVIQNGPIPPGLYACHKCDNRRCCNPNHIFLGTHMDNMIDRDTKGRVASGIRCWAFGKAGELNPAHTLSELSAKEIISKYKTGHYSQQALADLYKTTKTNVRQIIKGRTWKHLSR